MIAGDEPRAIAAGERRLVAAAALVALAVILTGVWIHEATGRLGTATPPFVMAFGWRADVAGALAALVAAFTLPLLAPRLLDRPRRPAAFVAAAFAVALAVGLALNALRTGTHGWYAVFDFSPGGSFEASNEVLAGLPAVSYGAWFLLDRYAELIPSQPVGLAGHTPGLPLLLHATGIDTAQRLAALCIVSLAAVAPATYALARSVGLDEPSARRAALIACASPALILFGISSTDAVFALVGTVTAALLCADSRRLRATGCLALAASALLSWALLAIGAFAVIVTLLRRGLQPALVLAAACGIAVLASQGALAAIYGYDPIGALRATSEVYRDGVASKRPYAFWVVGSPVAFAVMAGLPIAAAGLVAGLRRSPPAMALAVVLATAAILGFTKAEVERIWLPFVPLACVAAATVIEARWLRRALALLVAQALVTTLLFATIW